MRNPLGKKLFWFPLLSAVLACGCDRSNKTASVGPQYSDRPPATTSQTLMTFCVVPALTPTKVAQRYQLLTDLLRDRLKKSQQPDLQLVIARNHEDFTQRLNTRSFSIAVVSSATAVRSQELGYRLIAKIRGDEKYFGALLVPKTSTIKDFSDLRGKRISFPNHSVMSGSLMVRMFLHEHGLDRDQDYTAIYCDSYDSAVLTLLAGRCDVAAIGSGPWALLQRDRPELTQTFEIRFQTSPLPQLIMIAAPEVPQQVVNILTDTLVHLTESPEGRAALSKQNVDGYVPVDEAALVAVHQFMSKYQASFGSDDF